MTAEVATALVGRRARELLAARDAAAQLATITGADPSFAMADAYAVADEIRRLRIARGERALGYKIGFTNRSIWARYGVFEPIWGPVWDTTVERSDDARATVSLARFAAPRLEPEIMFGFARTPSAGATLEALFDCIEWVAHGFEIVDTRFADWRFAAADTVADFALHGRLLVGPRVPAARFDGARVAAELAAVEVVLSCDGRDVDSGRADVVLDGPLNALKLWVDAMAAQRERWPIVAGDIVSTGTITDAAPLRPGERWQTRLGDPRLAAMTLVTTP
jgi:2-oxo-3-hexenedioate decarboxylase